MQPISYVRAADVSDAIAIVSASPGAAFLAGGTTAIDLLRRGVETPAGFVDINSLPLDRIEELPGGGLRIGALTRMSDVAAAPRVLDRLPALAEALLLGASPQLRNMASMGGNLLQRARCSYFQDAISPCNKREAGSGCSALDGVNRGHAILGVSEHCIATHPSDAAVALVAFDATVLATGPAGERAIAVDDFFLLPGATPHIEHPLEHGELIVAIDLPALPIARRSVYIKVRDRASYEFALTSAAAALEVVDGAVADVRLALGGVATKPWRARRAEQYLVGKRADRETFLRAADEELAVAAPRKHNAFKVELARRTIVRALETVMSLQGAR